MNIPFMWNFIVLIYLLLFSNPMKIDAASSSTVFAKYPNKYFVESGSYLGDGIQNAINAHFEEIYSIELSPLYYEKASARFKNQSQVHIIFGDSAKILGDVISSIPSSITFWLDGHFSMGDTAKGDTNTPLLQELDWIRQHPIKTHTILIDDIRALGSEGFDWLSLDQVIKKLLAINPNYKIRFEDGAIRNDILVAYLSDEDTL